MKPHNPSAKRTPNFFHPQHLTISRIVCSGVSGLRRRISICISRMWLAPLESTNSRSNVLIDISVILHLP
jgi:hypothetical protein